MSDSEDAKVHEETTKSKSKRATVESTDSNEPGTDSTADSEGEKVDVPYDPNAKPAKSILKKPGEDSNHKAEGHIHIESTDDDGVHDAEKKKGPKKPMPVEGRSGVIVGGKTKRTISRGGLSDASSSSSLVPKDEVKLKDEKEDKKDKKEKEKKDKKDKKEKEKEKEKKKEKK